LCAGYVGLSTVILVHFTDEVHIAICNREKITKISLLKRNDVQGHRCRLRYPWKVHQQCLLPL